VSDDRGTDRARLTSSHRTVCSSRHWLRRYTKDCIDRCVKKFRISVRALRKESEPLELSSGDDDNDNELIEEAAALVVLSKPFAWISRGADECTFGATNAVEVSAAIAAKRRSDVRCLSMLRYAKKRMEAFRLRGE